MTHQTMRLRECLVTLGAGVLLHPHVSFHMCPQVSFLGKGLITGGAGEWLISCVCHLVFLHGPRFRESLVTLGAEIWFLPSVNSHMFPQAA